MEELKEIVRVMRNIGILIAGVSFIILMIKTAIDPDQKPKYIKLAKNVLTACVLITLSLSLVEIPKTYFGSTATITDGQPSDSTFGQIVDQDCQNRETINIDGKWYVVTDIDKKLGVVNDDDELKDVTSFGIYTASKTIENVSLLRPFSDCQGFFKGYYAIVSYYRDKDGFIFPRGTTYSEYNTSKGNGGAFTNNGRIRCWRRWRRCKIKKQ